jgi:hypothetical protein
MEQAEDIPISIDEMATKLKCARGWIQLSLDAGCPQNDAGELRVRDFMLFQLSNIHRIRELAGLPSIKTPGTVEDLRPNVKAILTTQLEWLQVRSTKPSVKKAAKLVFDKMQAIEEF